MNTKKEVKLLGYFADIRFGVHSQIMSKGTTAYLQARHFSTFGEMVSSHGSFADDEINLSVHLLKDGDILMAGKGARNFSWAYRSKMGPAVASTLFYVISVDQSIIYPEYLTTIINLPSNQAYFQKLSSSGSVASLRKKELAEFNVPVLPMEQQKAIAEFADLHKKEMNIANELTALKQNLYLATISKLIN